MDERIERDLDGGRSRCGGIFYVDGHVRVYSGSTANLAGRFASREKLCLRGTTDYWVNDVLGRPFFVVSKAVTAGLADSLVKDIVPQLLTSIPGQPSPGELDQDRLLHRFVVVFDRQGATNSRVNLPCYKIDVNSTV